MSVICETSGNTIDIKGIDISQLLASARVFVVVSLSTFIVTIMTEVNNVSKYLQNMLFIINLSNIYMYCCSACKLLS